MQPRQSRRQLPSNMAQGRPQSRINTGSDNRDFRSRYTIATQNLSQQQKQVEIKKRYKFQRIVNSPQHHLTEGLERIIFCEYPYQLQKDYMLHILKCLDEGKHCLIQSPTGSGKTLCLLSSVLAWVHHDNIKKFEKKEFLSMTNKIIYLSKTHSQIGQISQQLLKTCYRPTMVVMGSKQKLCVHPVVSQIKNHHEQNKKCNEAIINQGKLQMLSKLSQKDFDQLKMSQQQYKELVKNSCHFHLEYKKRFEQYKKVFKVLEEYQTVKIEDQRQENLEQDLCPYFYPGSTKYHANMVLMPYNYLTSAKILKRFKSTVQNSIVIFDEGHNILSSMCQGSSYNLKVNFIKDVLKDLEEILKHIDKKSKNQPQKKLTFDAEDLYSRRAEQQHLQKEKKKKQQKKQQQINIQQLLKNILKEFKQILLNFNKYCLEKARQMYQRKKKKNEDEDQDQGQDQQIKERISFKNIRGEMIEAFFGKNKKKQEYDEYIKKLKQYASCLSRIYNYQYQKSDRKFAPYSVIGFSQDLQEIANILSHEQKLSHFCLFMYYKKLQLEDQSEWKIKMVLYCFNPQFMFDKLMSLSPKSVIITSGTLAPLPSWKVATGLGEDLLTHSNNHRHVISVDQTRTVLVSTHEKYQLKIVKRNALQSVQKAYQTIKIICQNTPHGVLVVLGSKSWSKLFVEHQKKLETKNPLKKIQKKHIFFETQEDTRDIAPFLTKYEEAANSKQGAVLFLICRGKLSEGIDFKNNMARAVVMVGVPFKNISDVMLKQHKSYCDRIQKIDPDHQKGKDWQRQEIIRAINQSIGRVIRHSGDFGMIFLVDERYSKQWQVEYKYKENLSGWACKMVERGIDNKGIDTAQIPQICKKFFDKQRIDGRM